VADLVHQDEAGGEQVVLCADLADEGRVGLLGRDLDLEGLRDEVVRGDEAKVVAGQRARGPAASLLGDRDLRVAMALVVAPELAGVVLYHIGLLYIRFEYFENAFDTLAELLRAGNASPKVVEAFGLTMLRMPYLPKEIPAAQREKILIAGQAGINMAARRQDQARAAFDTLLAQYPNEPNVHYGFGVFMLSQDADIALKEFNRELEISPNHYPSMVQMAFEYLKRDQYNDALPLAEKAVQLAPKLYAARNVLGRVLLELGQVERSIKELEEGVKLAPSSPEMHFALARAYTRAGRKADAARERETFKKLQDEYNQKRQVEQKPN